MNKPELPPSHAGDATSRAAESTRLLAAALIPLGMLASTGAEAGVETPVETPLQSYVVGNVIGGAAPFTYQFTVFNDTESGSGVCEIAGGQGCRVIVDWELPFFSLDDLDLTSISQPDGWGHEILERQADGSYAVIDDTGAIIGDGSSVYFDNPDGPYGPYGWNYDADNDPLLDEVDGNPMLYGDNPHVFNEAPYLIHWVTLCDGIEVPAELSASAAVASGGALTCDIGENEVAQPLNPILEGESLGGADVGFFSFESGFSSQNAPYLASWFFFEPTSGDPPIPAEPFGTPLSPARLAAQDVPAPATALLLGAGLVAFSLYRRRALIA